MSSSWKSNGKLQQSQIPEEAWSGYQPPIKESKRPSRWPVRQYPVQSWPSEISWPQAGGTLLMQHAAGAEATRMADSDSQSSTHVPVN
jgi:hypothetical protein